MAFPYAMLIKIISFGAVASIPIVYLRMKYFKVKLQEIVNEGQFFSGHVCLLHMITPSCGDVTCALGLMSLMRNYIESARISLEICLYLLTSEHLCESIIKSFNRGVFIRVVTDAEMSLSTGSKINELRKLGIEVRMRDSTFIMHHKYIIIDDKVLINGSLNWTTQAICGNNDNLIITANEEVVKAFKKNWNYQWTALKPPII